MKCGGEDRNLGVRAVRIGREHNNHDVPAKT